MINSRQFVSALLLALVAAPNLAHGQGSPVGQEFQVNSYTTGDQDWARVGMAEDGEFVVVWHDYGQPEYQTPSLGIQAQRYAPDGNPLGGQFQVNAFTTSGHRSSPV